MNIRLSTPTEIPCVPQIRVTYPPVDFDDTAQVLIDENIEDDWINIRNKKPIEIKIN